MMDNAHIDTHIPAVVSGIVIGIITIGCFACVFFHQATFDEIAPPINLIIGYIVRDIQHRNSITVNADAKSKSTDTG